jgi:hypothetical protein
VINGIFKHPLKRDIGEPVIIGIATANHCESQQTTTPGLFYSPGISILGNLHEVRLWTLMISVFHIRGKHGIVIVVIGR